MYILRYQKRRKNKNRTKCKTPAKLSSRKEKRRLKKDAHLILCSLLGPDYVCSKFTCCSNSKWNNKFSYTAHLLLWWKVSEKVAGDQKIQIPVIKVFNSLQYSTEQSKREYISALIILSMLLELAKLPLAGSCCLEGLIGAEIQTLSLWSVLALAISKFAIFCDIFWS